jgi:hypothetical protein
LLQLNNNRYLTVEEAYLEEAVREVEADEEGCKYYHQGDT